MEVDSEDGMERNFAGWSDGLSRRGTFINGDWVFRRLAAVVLRKAPTRESIDLGNTGALHGGPHLHGK